MALCRSACRLHGCPPPPSVDGSLQYSTKVYGYGFPSSVRQAQSLAVRSQYGQLVIARSMILHTVATPDAAGLGQGFQKQGSRFADMLGNIANLYSEAGQERRAAAECVERTVEESGRSAEDYGRRALLFEQSGKMAMLSKVKGDRLKEELEVLQVDILECDEGRSAADYLLRAELFSKSAEIFGTRVL